jgi:hypothetical protein
MAERIAFTLVINNRIHTEDSCGNCRREIQTTSESLLYELHKFGLKNTVNSHAIYYTIKSKAL